MTRAEAVGRRGAALELARDAATVQQPIPPGTLVVPDVIPKMTAKH